MKHNLVKHTNCQETHCNICDGGLACCRTCMGAENTLATECPGRPITSQEASDIKNKRLNFINNEWQSNLASLPAHKDH